MIFEQHNLPAALQNCIESIFYINDFVPEHSMERVVPTGHVFMIFEFDNITRTVYDNKTLAPAAHYKNVWVSGMHKEYITISAHRNSEMLVVQFKPAGAFPFFQTPLHKLSGLVVDAVDIFGDSVLELRNEMLASEHVAGKFYLIEKWLLKRYDGTQLPSRDLLSFINRLQEEPVCKLNQVVDSYPHSQKQLILHFRKYLGLTPKQYQRILRFNEILKSIHGKQEISWADIAYNCDYSDQSHFIKEFTFFSGLSPRTFIKKDLSQDQYTFIPLDIKG